MRKQRYIINTQIQKAERSSHMLIKGPLINGMPNTKKHKNICFENNAIKRAFSLHGNIFENRSQYIFTLLYYIVLLVGHPELELSNIDRLIRWCCIKYIIVILKSCNSYSSSKKIVLTNC